MQNILEYILHIPANFLKIYKKFTVCVDKKQQSARNFSIDSDCF